MPLDLIITTPQGETSASDVERISLPGSEGEFGVLEGHESMVTTLVAGALEVLYSDGRFERLEISEGFVEVRGDLCTVIVAECLGPVTREA